ncbi:MAG: hypothetical protein JWP73_1444 [Phenylobacterium sp.]|nr:hypothetical protein [Phenylobacterium sp.]
MIRYLLSGALAVAMLGGSAMAAPAASSVFTWIITPDEDSCHTDIELIGRSNNPAMISLVSDGEHVQLKFAKDEMPKRAFLAVDIDKKPYSNLLTRLDPKVGTMTLSDETLTALRKGGTLLIAWLADEPVSAKLTGSEQGLNDLRICGAQVSGQYRAQVAARQDAQARVAAEARAKQLADEQLALVRAQKKAAEAQTQQVAQETRRQQAEADAQRQRAEEEDQVRAAEARRQEYLQRYYPPRPTYPPPGYYRPPYPNDDGN